MIQNENQTEQVVTKYLQQLAQQDADAIAEFFAEDVDWYVGGNDALPWTGHRAHRADVADFFRTMWPHFAPGQSTATLHKIVIAGEEAVVFATFLHTAMQTGRSFETPVAMRVTVADGQIVRMHLYEDTWLVSKAFVD